jgi:predicted permease
MCLDSFARLLRTDLGFDANHLVLVKIEGGATQTDWARLVEAIEGSPGVQSASMSGWSLFQGTGRNKSVRIPGRGVDSYDPWFLPVSPGFLRTMRIPLVSGREFEWRDAQPESPSAVIVNEAFARRYFPGESALARRFFRVDVGNKLVAQDIVGIAGDARYTSIRGDTPPTVYDPLRPEGFASVQIRTQLELRAVAALVREVLPRVHPAFRATEITLQSTLVDNTLVRDRALALLSAFFSIVAIVLVAVGLYGVLSYSVIHRTREIGIRLALGAQPGRILRLLIADVGVVMGIGVVAGAAGGIAASRFVVSLLYEVTPMSLSSVSAPLLSLAAVCLVAGLLPAMRATRVDPATVMRCE